MDLVDIDKVLDDFELNEDNNDNGPLNNDKNINRSEQPASVTHKNITDFMTNKNTMEQPFDDHNPPPTLVASSHQQNFQNPVTSSVTSKASTMNSDEILRYNTINGNANDFAL